MKRIALALFALSLVFGASYGLAEMGGGMMKGHEGETGGMMKHEGMHAGMMSREDTAAHLKDMMKHMSGMMDQMSGIIKTANKDKMRNMHAMMNEMGAQLKDMTKMMDAGVGSREDMQMMKDRQKHMELIMKGLRK